MNLSFVLAMGMAVCAGQSVFAGVLDDESNRAAPNATPAVTNMGSDASTDANVTNQGEPTKDAHGVALPGHEVKSDELKAVEAGEKCMKFTKDERGRLLKSETVACEGVNYTQKDPGGSDGKADEPPVMGADARDQKVYNPPKDFKLGGQPASWAKYESYRQVGQMKGYSEQAIQGMGARLQVESAGTAFGMKSIGATNMGDKDTGGSFGIEQWHLDRANNMIDYVNDQRAARANATNTTFTPASKSNLTNSAYDQYNYVFDELETNPSVANYKVNNQLIKGEVVRESLKTSTNANAAAELWTRTVEKPANAGEKYGLSGGNATFANVKDLVAQGDNSYVPDTAEWGKKTYTQRTGYGDTGSTSSGSSGNGGIGNMLSSLGGGNAQNMVQNFVTQMTGGNGQVGGLVNAALNGQLTQQNLVQIATAMAIEKLSGGGSSDSDSSDSSSSGGSSSSSSSSSASATKTDYNVRSAVREIAASCGAELPQSKDALMLLVKTCQSPTVSRAGDR